jgi:steroid delta-isomerase-like uncharacterized protein
MEPAALVAAYYAAFNRQDWDGMCALLAEDVEHGINESGAESGRAAFRRFLDRMDRCYVERLEDVTVFPGPAGRVAAEYVVVGTYRATDAGLPEARGQTYRLRGGAFFETRGGLVTRVTNYYSLRDWLRQVG